MTHIKMVDVTKDVKTVIANTKTIQELQKENADTIFTSRVEGIADLAKDFGNSIAKVEVSEINDCKFSMRVSYKELTPANLSRMVNHYRTDKIFAEDGLIIVESSSVD